MVQQGEGKQVREVVVLEVPEEDKGKGTADMARKLNHKDMPRF